MKRARIESPLVGLRLSHHYRVLYGLSTSLGDDSSLGPSGDQGKVKPPTDTIPLAGAARCPHAAQQLKSGQVMGQGLSRNLS